MIANKIDGDYFKHLEINFKFVFSNHFRFLFFLRSTPELNLQCMLSRCQNISKAKEPNNK